MCSFNFFSAALDKLSNISSVFCQNKCSESSHSFSQKWKFLKQHSSASIRLRHLNILDPPTLRPSSHDHLSCQSRINQLFLSPHCTFLWLPQGPWRSGRCWSGRPWSAAGPSPQPSACHSWWSTRRRRYEGYQRSFRVVRRCFKCLLLLENSCKNSSFAGFHWRQILPQTLLHTEV